MTRFTQAVSVAFVNFAIWWRLLTWPDVAKSPYFFHFQYFPIYFLIGFGVISVTIILYRVATFNNCIEANEELKRQIKQAQADLADKGFRFSANNDVKAT